MLSVFNQILAVMTTFDTLYLVTSITEFSFVETFHITSVEYDTIFVFFLYPFHNVTLCCSIFLHVILAFERYLAVCHPQLVYSQTQQRRNKANTAHHHSQNTWAVRKKVRQCT